VGNRCDILTRRRCHLGIERGAPAGERGAGVRVSERHAAKNAVDALWSLNNGHPRIQFSLSRPHSEKQLLPMLSRIVD
jgi:hypothetical protein